MVSGLGFRGVGHGQQRAGSGTARMPMPVHALNGCSSFGSDETGQ